jgi:predicted component of type VI protein secretion system
VRLHPETLEPLGQGDIPLLQRSINLGSAEVDDPSVSLKHARIWADGESRFMVADAGSVAGTWVNLAPVEREGTPMQHGDVINFGRAVFRFEALKPVERVIKVEII